MMRSVGGLIAGLMFGAGLSISGMINPAKVIGFLDLAGKWDPSLAFVMLGGVLATALGYKAVLRRGQPIFEPGFSLPTRRDIDPSLLLGAAIFGVGWGLAGYCPGPVIAGLGFGRLETSAFAASMLVGMAAARLSGGYFTRLSWPKKSSA